MDIFDISLPISEDMPVWPGDPAVAIRQVSMIENGDSSNVSQIKMSVHTGTHIDAPKHFLNKGKTIDQLVLDKLIGEALVMALDEHVRTISAEVLSNHPQSKLLEHARKVLFKTKNSLYWHSCQSVFQEDYVGIDTSGAEYLAKLDLDLIGVDYLSIATYHDTDVPHQVLLQKEIILLEGIDLSEVTEGIYTLYCLPLLLAGCEGAPARAILVKPSA